MSEPRGAGDAPGFSETTPSRKALVAIIAMTLPACKTGQAE
jgi:hypothetical protein